MPVINIKFSSKLVASSLLFATGLLFISQLISCSGKMGMESTASSLTTTGIRVPEGFSIEPATCPGMVRYPMFATLDHQGRLFVIESSGKTTSTEDVLKNPTFQILLLEDTDEDGTYDKRSIFADSLPYPMGGTFYKGSFYATAPPDLIRFTDNDDDGIADQREVILTGWVLNHNAATLSGPFFGPDGWMYMCDARRSFDIQTKEGTRLQGKGARIWRCRPDGTGLEWISGGGFDNTIELIFMPAGETIGTMTYFTEPQNGFRDALMHWVEGGVYPKPYSVIAEDRLKLTGELMPVMTKLARVSPAGLMRYRGTSFGPDFAGNLFSAQFNTGRIMRHVITRNGATFRTTDEPFMRCDSLDMHPTDVLEDADGSLLVVNTGGWFIAGCPLSVVAKTDVHGGIYRIRKLDAPTLDDPWGKDLDLQNSTHEQLARLFSDSRPMVRDRAIERMVEMGENSVGPLGNVLNSSTDEAVRTAAVFALYRINTAEAIGAVLSSLDDKSMMVRTAAARVLGLAKERKAVKGLTALLETDSLIVARQAATALGQIADRAAVVPLLAAAARTGDRFLEHAITHSLISLAVTEPVVEALQHPAENVRKTALIVLDQIDHSPLRKDDLLPFFESKNPSLQETGLWVASHHADWGDIVIRYFEKQLASENLQDGERKTLMDLMTSFSHDPAVQKFVSSQLQNPATPEENKLFLLDVIQQSMLNEFPDGWVRPLKSLLEGKNFTIRAAVLALIQSRNIPQLTGELHQIIRDPRTPSAFRLKALNARIMTDPLLTEEEFKTVVNYLGAENELPVRQTAVRLLAQAQLNDAQLLTLSGHLNGADIFLLPDLVTCFEGNKNEKVGKSLVAALSASPDRLDNLSFENIQKIINAYPVSVSREAEPLMKMLVARQASRLSVLEKLQASLHPGDVGEGRKLFYGKALCSSCHAVMGQGGKFGPDLTNIGEIRSQHDILEAILYPSASLAREYETSKVITKTTSYTGIVKDQLPESIALETGPGLNLRVPRSEIESIESDGTSLMPPALHKQFTTEEMSNLMAYLTSLPDGMGHLKSQ